MKRLRRATWADEAADGAAEPARWTPMPWNAERELTGPAGEAIAGYRVLRRLGGGSRSTVYLGRAWGSDAAPPGLALTDAALKMFPPHGSVAQIDYEVAALDAIRSRHVVRLLDIATLGDGRTCLVLSPCIGGSLPTVLDRSGSIEAGEAVTVLAPLFEALADVHHRGWSHGSLRLSSILFDEVAAPVLTGWGHGAALTGREDPSVSADRERFLVLADGVLDRVSGLPDPAAVSILGERLAHLVRSNAPSDSVVDLLFDFADPLPLAGPTEHAPERAKEDRAARATGSIRLRAAPATVPDSARNPPRLPESVGPLHSARNRIGAELARVRRPVWVVAALAVAAAIAIPLVPSGIGGASTQSSGDADPRSGPPATAIGRVPTPEASSGSKNDTPGAPQPDDPVAAGVTLLAARAACFEERSVLCLDDVDSAGSAALEADRNTMRAMQEGRAADQTLLDGRAAALVERLGDSALLDLVPPPGTSETAPASLLLQRGEAGWRIRSVLVGNPLDATLPAAD